MLKIQEMYFYRDLSLQNLRYLNSRQALADLANFIDWFRQQSNLPDNKLITFGGSYPGLVHFFSLSFIDLFIVNFDESCLY